VQDRNEDVRPARRVRWPHLPYRVNDRRGHASLRSMKVGLSRQDTPLASLKAG
jgi:hypothetical protein